MDKVSKWSDIDYEKYTERAKVKSESEEEPKGWWGKLVRLFDRNDVPDDQIGKTIHTNYEPRRSFGSIFWETVETNNRRK
jgi:hypothetical protein